MRNPNNESKRLGSGHANWLKSKDYICEVGLFSALYRHFWYQNGHLFKSTGVNRRTMRLRWTGQSRAAFARQYLTGSFYLYHSFSVIVAQPLSFTLDTLTIYTQQGHNLRFWNCLFSCQYL